MAAEDAPADAPEEVERLEAESRRWIDSRRYEGLVIGCAIRIVMRDARLSGTELSVMLGLGKTRLYRWMGGGFHGKPFEAAALWGRLAEIREQYRAPAAAFFDRNGKAAADREVFSGAQA